MENIKFYKIPAAPFKVYGLCEDIEKNGFRRIPEDVARATSESVFNLSRHTSGGRVRFRTDSEKIVVKIVSPFASMYHATPLMILGVDVYADHPYGSELMGVASPSGDNEFTANVTMPEGEYDVTVNLPLYGAVDNLEIGICDGASLKEHSKPYQNELPVVFYGSSITQGGCASRPGRAYQALISKKYNMNYTCLGFSGSACAEDAICEYMSGLKMSAFVSDYDHNAPTHEYLAATHHKLYLKIREKNPDIPYFMITRPDFYFDSDCIGRRDIIMKSYLEARRNGDKNVYFIDGSAFFNGEKAEECTLDRCHPNDEGFKKMANYIGDVIAKVMKF